MKTFRDILHTWLFGYLQAIGGILCVTESLKSTVITNRDATPAVINDGRLAKGSLRESIGSVTTTTGKTTGSKYTLCSVPSSAIVSQILLSCAALGTATAADVGVYRNTADGGAAVDADFFATAVDLSAALSNSDITNESGTYTLDKQEQPLWQAAGMSADPMTSLDIVVTSTATIAAGGLLSLKVRYRDNSN